MGALWDRAWVWNTAHCWYNYPFHPLGNVFAQWILYIEYTNLVIMSLRISCLYIQYRICQKILLFGGTICLKWPSTGLSFSPSSLMWNERWADKSDLKQRMCSPDLHPFRIFGRCLSTTWPRWPCWRWAGATTCIGWVFEYLSTRVLEYLNSAFELSI